MAKAHEAVEEEAKRAGGPPAPGETTKTCGNCGAENGEEWTFCFHCRVPFEAGKKAAKKSRAKAAAKAGAKKKSRRAKKG